MEYLLEIENLHAGYDKRAVLHGVSLHVQPGEIVALIGPNGSGKSTLLKSIFGMVQVGTGAVRFQGRDITNRNPADNVRDGMSFVLQGSRVFTDLSVRENLEIGGYILPRREVMPRIDEVLSFFPDLKPMLKKTAGDLSTGQKQMLAMGRALMLKPALLLADEPSLGLGPKLVHTALECLKDLNEEFGTATLLVEQNVREALQIASRAYALRLGRIVLCDTPCNLTDDRLREAFLG